MKHKGRDNSNVELKVAVRRAVASEIEHWRVLDLYCGSHGLMYREIWHQAESYLGTDKDMPHALAPTLRIRAELASQHFDLDSFNVFDVDCYDSPWLIARRIVRRRGPGRFALILTTGESRGLRSGSANELIRSTLGLSKFSDLRLLDRYRYVVWGVMLRSLIESAAGVSCVKLVRGETGRFMQYYGLLLDKRADKGV